MDVETRLPQSQRESQHPLSDQWFTHAKAILEACAVDSGGCEECDLKNKCVPIFDSLSDKCCDSPLTAHDLIEWAVKF